MEKKVLILFFTFNVSLKDWLDNYCNKRIHGTTKEKPLDLFLKEEKIQLNEQKKLQNIQDYK